MLCALIARGQVASTLTGPAGGVNCGTVYFTNRIVNNGSTVTGLYVTNELPSASYAYVPGLSTVTLPGGAVLTNAAADPAVNNNSTNLVWDFSSVTSDSPLGYPVISEVYYNTTQAPEDENEWVEIFNPTPAPINLAGWSLRDAAPGQVDALPAFTINPGEYVAVAGRTNAFLTANPGYTNRVFEVADGKLGSGLNNFGDGVFLLNAASAVVDAVSYGASTLAFSPAVPGVAAGRSIERNPANNDSNTRNDWVAQPVPNPGTGTVPLGLQNGAVITVVYAAEISCAAVSGQLFSRAGFSQGGAPGSAVGSAFLTVSEPDLVVFKEPILQDAGVGDTVTWLVRVQNSGFGAAPNVVAADLLGPGLEFTGFSVAPSSASTTSAVWDATAVPAFTNLAAQTAVDILVTARVVSCQGLYNLADAQWSCSGLAVLSNSTCEATGLLGETAVAGIRFIDRYPDLSIAVAPDTLAVDYCAGSPLTLTITNPASAGYAENLVFTPQLPPGWTVSGSAVDTNGLIQVGRVLPGTSTSVTFTVTAGGACPIETSGTVYLFLRPAYTDTCGNPFFGPLVSVAAEVVDEPSAAVTKIMPASVSPDGGPFPVRIELTYSNFVGTESVRITDLYPVHTNLYATNASAGGVLNSTSVVWNITPGAGSGVVTTSFQMAFRTNCGGPGGLAFNQIFAENLTNCLGCPIAVAGSGFQFPLAFDLGAGCGGSGGTNGCDFAGSKTVVPTLTEVCRPVMLTHTFNGFTGASNDWTGVVFTSDLGGGTVDTTNEVTVLVNGSNLTAFVSFTQAAPSLILNLAGLNGSGISNLASVTSVVVAWPVSAATPGQVVDTSMLTLPGCGTESDAVVWYAGESDMEIGLPAIFLAAACGSSTGRIDLIMNPSPGGVPGVSNLFSAYDVEVVLDLDADGDLTAGYTYIPGSTVFSNLVDTGGAPLTGFDPVVSGNRLIWNLGDLGTNTGMAITYRLRPGCESDSNGLSRATLRYNNRCGNDVVVPPARTETSQTNGAPPFVQPSLLSSVKPELQFLVSTQIVNQIHLFNSSGVAAYNLRVEMDLPPNVSFGSAEIPPTAVTSSNVVWTFTNLLAAFGPLQDLDGDGQFDDLVPRQEFQFWVTNRFEDCSSTEPIRVRSAHGCGGASCYITPDDEAEFIAISGSLVTRATFPAENALCGVNPVEYRVRNSGLTVDYDVQAYQTVPLGMAYVSGSSQVSLNGGPTNSIADPPGTGLPGDPLTWTAAQIPLLAAMQPNDEVAIFYDVQMGCSVATADNRFVSEGRYTDLCGDVVSNRQVISVLSPAIPELEVLKTASTSVADLNQLVTYTLTVRHAAGSAADVPFLVLTDTLPAQIAFVGASVAPDAVAGQVLTWSNATLLARTGDGVAPFALGESNITITVTGRVTGCALSVVNTARLDYGCSAADACLTDSASVSMVTIPILEEPAAVNALALTACGGTKTVTITNRGASTQSDIIYTEYAPPGYIFTGATASGEFTSAGLIVTYTGTPVGAVAIVDFSTDASSGATDAKDDIGDGLANLELGQRSGFRVVWSLASAGGTLDCLADPTDLDFEDPEQGDPTSLTSSNRATYTDLCAGAGSVGAPISAFPGIADLDIDLQPNSQIVTNGETVAFTLRVLNDSETTAADGIHVRVRLGTGWTNLTYVSSNIVSSGATAMDFEQQGNSNLLMRFPGVILDPIDDEIEVTFTAQATQNGGALDAYAEVVGDCGNPAIVPSCTFSNTLGQAAFADTLAGGVIGAVNGQYYSYDQDRFAAAGHTLSKTVRYNEELAAAADTSRIARVGEDLVYRLEATYFGGTFSNVTVTDTLPVELGFGTPVNYAFSGGITGAVWDAGTGVFTLQPAVLATNPSTFAVDIPVVVSNRLDVQDGAVITNTATTAFSLPGVTNVPLERSTTVPVREPNLALTKTASTNLVQAGDIILFTNRLVHTGLSTTSAYNLVFTDTLPPGMAFNAFVSPATGSVAGNVITFTTNDSADLVQFDIGEPAIEFVFSVLVTNQLVGATVTNRSLVSYMSLDAASTNGNQRTGVDGVGGLNDYVATAQVAVASRALGNLTKTFVSSTQTNTLDGLTNDWTIGERFIYQIRVDLPQGVVSNLVLNDVVPAGIDWVGGNTNAGLAYPGRGYEFEIPAGGPQFPTNAGPGLAITDTDPTPASSTTTDGSGLPVRFTFAAITNAADGSSANDYFLLRLEFVALNLATNAGIAPNPRRGSNVVSAADAFTTRGATGPVYRIVEHDVRTLKRRSLATPDAGDVMTFTLIASNQVNALANAYDVRVTDTLSSNLYDLATFTLVSLPPGWGTTNVAVAGGIRFEMFSSNEVALPPGGGATGVFTVALAQGVRPNQVYTNRMDITESTTLYGLPPGGIAERNDTANNSVTFTVPGLGLAKTLDATSETNLPPDSTGSNVQIGERLTYRLAITLPESTLTNLTVVDTLTTNGLAYIFGSARLVTTGFVGSTGAFSESPSGAANTLSSMGQQMTFAFTNVVVTGDNDTNNNTFYLLADYLALDQAANDGLPPGVTVHTNRATLTYGGNPGAVVTSAVVTTTVVEPRLQIAKRLTPTSNVDAGDVISVTLAVTNSGTATAYDVVIGDRLALPYFDIATLANVAVPTGFVYEVAGDLLRFRSDTNAPTGTNTIEAGEALVFTFDVRTAGTLPPNVVVTNTATVLGDSLARTNIFGVQRFTGHTNSATFTADDFDPTKVLISTSETGPADSTGTNLQIGEYATYEIAVRLPEGTITDLQVTDALPAGMAYVAGSLAVNTNDLNGTLAPATNITPNVPPLGASGEDVVITWTGDSVLAASTNPSANILRLRLDAVVLDLPANSGLAPQTLLTNTASITYAGNPNPPATVTGPVVRLVEPLTAITKTVTPDFGDAGDEITVTLTATNGGLATAYDLAVTDLLDGTVFNVASVTNVSMPAGFTFGTTPSGANLTVRYASDSASGQPTNTLETGESLAFVFTVHLAQSVVPGGLYTNGVRLDSDTIYATNIVGIQRGYTNTAQDTLSISNMAIAKALTGTSLIGPVDTVDPDVTIGERATYLLTVTLPEATITNLTVVDVLPAGLQYMPGSVAVDPTDFGGTLPGAPVVTTSGGSGDDVTIAFPGLTVVDADNDPDNNSFAVELELLVLDVPGNDGLPAGVDGDGTTTLPNSATVAYGGNPPVATSTVVNVDVVEPLLAITKTMALQADNWVTIDLVVSNRGLSTAFDVEIQDLLPVIWWDTDTIAPVTVPAGFTFAFAGNPGDATITLASDPASEQPTNSIEVAEVQLFRFQARLRDGAPSPVTNRAAVTEHSTVDGPDPFERDEPDAEDEDELPVPNYTLNKVLTSPVGRAAAVGETVTFDLVIANTGALGLDPVPLVDTYDTAYLTYAGAVPVSADNDDDGTLNWANVGPLGVGQSVTVAVSFVAAASTLPGDTTNQVVASPSTTNGIPLPPKTNAAPVPIAIVGYTLEKDRISPTNRPALIGEPVVFRITVVNTGEVELVTVPVTDTYETTYLTYVSSAPASDNNDNDGTLDWADIGPLAAGASTSIVATFTAAADTLGADRTNVVVTTPTTPTNMPPVPPRTNDAPYQIDSPASLGDFVWLDADGNGVQGGAGETGLPDVVVTLFDGASNVVNVTTTGVAGAYAFTNLPPGTYFVGFAPPAGYQFTLLDQGGDDALDSDADRITGRTVPTQLVSGENDPTWDAGLYLPASLGDFVWLDVDGNGVQGGAGETGLPDVVVTLFDAATNVVNVTTTDVNGAYAFTNLIPATYFVGFAPPAGYQITLVNQGGDPALDSDADRLTGRTNPTQLVSGENDPTWDAGLYVPASLGDFVWLDADGNGVQGGAGETGLPDVVVTLFDAASNAVNVTTTDVNGAYAFTNLIPATYFVGFAPPAGYQITLVNQGGDPALDSDADRVTGRTNPTQLVSGENDPTWDAGLYVPASLGDFVWLDADGNGVQGGAGETGLPDVVVTLFDAASNAVNVTTTDVNGAYAFTNLIPATYFVGFAPPPGYTITLQDQGGNDTLDSDADRTTGRTVPTVLISGENDPTWDAGLYQATGLGDRVWEDRNADGIQDAGEPGVANVVVTLYDAADAVVGVTTTDVNGGYAFTGLRPDDYYVRVTVPAGWYVSPQDQGADDTVDSDIDAVTGAAALTTLASGESDPTWDAGLYQPASLGDFVWLDADGDGIQSLAEPGVSNVTVTLYDANTNALDTTTTDALGRYAFTNLVPGVYFVGITPPPGYQITLRDQGGDDARDSDADRITGYMAPTTLISGENDLDWDAGLYEPARLGDFVWEDTDADGIQDAGEPGISNVVVTLYDAADAVVGVTTTDVNGAYAFTNLIPAAYYVDVTVPADWVVSPQDQGGDDAADSDIDAVTGETTTITLVSGQNDPTWDAGLYRLAALGDYVWEDLDADGIQDAGETGIPNVTVTLYDAATNAVDTTTTDAGGLYAFTNLVPDVYFVGFTTPAGWYLSPRDQGGDDAVDSDADQTTGYAAPTELVSGENDPTWDAGLYRPASLGDFVWEDRNGDGLQQALEPPVPGVRVRLYDAQSNQVAATVTDANGLYAFTNLVPGTYFIGFDRPAGYRFTRPDQGGDVQDSDADPASGRTVPTTLISGENDPTWDAGLIRPAAIGDYVWVDENWDGIQDAGEPGIANVRVELRDLGDNLVAETLTDTDGRYLFDNLPPGFYWVRVDAATLDPRLAANPTYDLDGTRDNQTAVSVNSGDVFLRADFGYNWEPANGVLGALGDRVWVDANADGAQDPGEPGIPNVTVELYGDPLGTGVYTTLVGTAVTDAGGLYLFSDLPAGAYVVRVATNTLPAGYLQTGDPDSFGAPLPAGTGDHRTTAPVVLAPGDVFLNADFGYWPPRRSNLGDLIFLDANADGVFNGDDRGLAGVTVALLDNNGDVIASTITDDTGWYLFTGLPAGTYTVWVNDTAGVLSGLVQTADPDGGLDSRSTTTLDGVNDDLLQDHGYAPDGQEDGLGLIGDTVFLDGNNNGQPDDGEGIAGVTVRLIDTNGVIQTTVTDADGRYYFGGLPAGTYTVRVDTNTLPNGGLGLLNTVDPDTASPGDHTSTVSIGAGGINLLQDFGYVPAVPKALGGTLWRDCNDDGLLDPGEERLAGVTVALWGERLIGNRAFYRVVDRTVTDANGDYLFTGLVDGFYLVDVTDEANVLNGHWHSYGPNPGQDNNSQVDLYAVNLNGSVETNTTADFGYYLPVAELGDYVWYDINEDGLQDGGEPGLAHVWVTLRIEYPTNNIVVTMQTQTASNGFYRFANLLLFENPAYRSTSAGDPVLTGQPRLQVSVNSTQAVLALDAYLPTLVNAGTGTNDSREHTGTYVELAKCGQSTTNDFGYGGGPLLAVIGNVDAFTRDGRTIVRWETVESWGTAGFWLERLVDGQWVRISQDLIPFPLFGVAPIVYEETDPGAVSGGTYQYRLAELENDGDILCYGPYTLTVDGAGRTYEAWAAGNFTPEQLADPAIGGRMADPDGDGLTNGQEFLAGTDPWNANSVLQVTKVRRTAEGLELGWNSVPGKTYRIAISQSMMGPFFPLEEAIVAADSQTIVILPVDFQDRQLYFQVILADGAE